MVEVGYHRTFPSVYLLVELILVLPIATATVEHTVFAINIVKSNLRNKMGMISLLIFWFAILKRICSRLFIMKQLFRIFRK